MPAIDSQTYNNLLFLKVKNNNRKAFRALFDQYWQAMFISAKSIITDEDIAKDIVQDIWLNLWQNRKTLNVKNFEGYIFKSVNYGCIKYLRNNKFNTIQTQAIESLQNIVASDIENQHNLEKTQLVIENSLRSLSPRCQQIFRLGKFDESSNDEIALQLGISKRSVENQISIAKRYIRQNLLLAQSFIIGFFTLFTS
jgi:RNA polymerase sigma-70 factor (family 1)